MLLFSDTSKWAEVRSDTGRGYESQGFEGYFGYSWYRQTIAVPKEVSKHKHVRLLFGAVDLEGEIYINGKKAFSYTKDDALVDPVVMWRTPFSFHAKKWIKPGPDNVIAVRIHNTSGMGGIWKPAFLVGCDVEADTKSLYQYVVSKGLLKPLELDWKWLDPKFYEMPPLTPHPHEAFLGARLQRTMTLLATSNARQRNPVKILFYGQSIVAGMPWKKMIQELRDRYPYANIIAANRAIGGCTAPCLVRRAVHDVYPFYPDLVIFNVGAGELTGELERIVYNIRKHTTAEILMYTHTVSSKKNEKFPSSGPSTDLTSCHRRYLAQKYDCELVEVRDEWLGYLREHKLSPNELMGDTVRPTVHPNKKGYTLLSKLIMRHLRLNTLFPSAWGQMVRTYEARRAIEEEADETAFTGKPWGVPPRHYGVVGRSPDSALKLRFHGNRVDVVSMPCAELGTARIRIDGKPPSRFPSAYACTRPSETWAIARVTLGGQPLVEDWTFRLTEISEDGKDFAFEVIGSVTGPDGKGRCGEPFVSKSGRVRLHPMDVSFGYVQRTRKRPLQPGHEITWQVVPMFLDAWSPGKDPHHENHYTLVQGIENREHVLEIIPNGDGNVPVKSIVVHEPPNRVANGGRPEQ